MVTICVPFNSTISSHIVKCLCNSHAGLSLLNMGLTVTPHRWSSGRMNRLEMYDAQVFMIAECKKISISVQQSTLKHSRAGRGFFGWNRFVKGAVISCLYGYLVYGNLSDWTQHHRKFRDSDMGVTVEYLEKWTILANLPNQPLKGKRRKVWAVPARICEGQYSRDPRYFTCDNEVRLSQTETANPLELRSFKWPDLFSSFRNNFQSSPSFPLDLQITSAGVIFLPMEANAT